MLNFKKEMLWKKTALNTFIQNYMQTGYLQNHVYF